MYVEDKEPLSQQGLPTLWVTLALGSVPLWAVSLLATLPTQVSAVAILEEC